MEALVAKLHQRNAVAPVAARLQAVVAATGAGSTGISALQSAPGASGTLLEGCVPYARAAFQDFLATNGTPPLPPRTPFASSFAAGSLGAAALARSKRLIAAAAPSVYALAHSAPTGVGLSGAVRTDRELRGGHRIFCSLRTERTGLREGGSARAPYGCALDTSLELLPGLRERAEEEAVACRMIVACVVSQVTGEGEAAAAAHEAFSKGGAAGAAGAGISPEAWAMLQGQLRAEAVPAAAADASSERHLEVLRLKERPLAHPLLRLLAGAGEGGSSAPLEPHDEVTHLLFAPPPQPEAGSAATAGGALLPGGLRPGGEGWAAMQANAPLAALCAPPPGHPQSPFPVHLMLLPGSFYPLHGGHEAMGIAAVRVAARMEAEAVGVAGPVGEGGAPTTSPSGRPWALAFELSAANVDKPSLAAAEVLRRVSQFADLPPYPGMEAEQGAAAAAAGAGAAPGASSASVEAVARSRTATVSRSGCTGSSWPVVVTRAPRFVEKAALFPGASFAVGFDTAARLVHPRYYGGSSAAMESALVGLLASGGKIFVAGRAASAAPLPPLPAPLSGAACAPLEGFLTLSAHLLPRVPPTLHPLFVEIPEAEFRADVSSSQLRAAAAAAAAASAAAGGAGSS